MQFTRDIPWFDQMIDFPRGVKVTGAGFPFYVGEMSQLVRALINFFLEEAGTNGYEEVHSPIVVNAASATATGQLPDKEGQMYLDQNEEVYLIPTAEVPVTNFFRDEILSAEQLPIKRCAYTPCFRREAGSWGKDVRGLNRLHQFDKVELVKWTHPDESFDELEKLRNDAEGLLQNSNFHIECYPYVQEILDSLTRNNTTWKFGLQDKKDGWKFQAVVILQIFRQDGPIFAFVVKMVNPNLYIRSTVLHSQYPVY